ncbi:hypothetical protein L2E82_22267 [Cichorium intybus]|uniref:Uncharacterized protein n=1 Tax=Cichorium intybus TaxID=13427 RepID=A0ACB9DX58_CICIN|nr:hypothetical protein L2E82_22267 [Cichorium intybus]
MDLRPIGGKSLPDLTSLRKSIHFDGHKVLQATNNKEVGTTTVPYPLLNITTSFVAEEQAVLVNGDEDSTNESGHKKKFLPSVSTSLTLASAFGIMETIALFFGSGLLLNTMGSIMFLDQCPSPRQVPVGSTGSFASDIPLGVGTFTKVFIYTLAIDGADVLTEDLDLVAKMNFAVKDERYSEAGT